MNKTGWKVFLMLLFLITGELWAQNLLTNGHFDANFDGWSNPFVMAEWVSDDGASISGNGSMLVTGTINNNGTFGMNSDAFTVQSNYWYLTAGSFKTPATSVSERGLYFIEWYDSEGSLIRRDSTSSDFGVDDDVWIDLDGYLQAPPLAVSAVMRLMLQTGSPDQTDPPFGLWDDAVVMQETVFTDGFD